jgi:chromosome partitioning protein
MVIVVINNKGGTGKTTTCVNLSVALANSGYQVLLIDLDSQASASLSLGVRWDNLVPSVANVLFNRTAIEDAIRPSTVPHLDLLTGEMELANTDLILADVPGRENLLAESLKEVREDYDFIICDCPPSLSMLPVNALMTADGYIVPVTPEYLALEGLVSLMDAIERIKQGMDIDAELLGIVFTLVNWGLRIRQSSRTARKIIGIVREHYGQGVFRTKIRRDVRLSDAPSVGKSIFEFAPRSRVARAHAMFAREVIERCGVNVEGKQSSKESTPKHRIDMDRKWNRFTQRGG